MTQQKGKIAKVSNLIDFFLKISLSSIEYFLIGPIQSCLRLFNLPGIDSYGLFELITLLSDENVLGF